MTSFSEHHADRSQPADHELCYDIHEVAQFAVLVGHLSRAQILGNLPKAFADSSPLRQVFVILEANALKFTRYSTQPAIAIDGWLDQSKCLYSIRDNGARFDMHHANSILKGGRVVFNIKSNDYRLITVVQYAHGMLMIRFFGSHEEYDKVDAEIV